MCAVCAVINLKNRGAKEPKARPADTAMRDGPERELSARDAAADKGTEGERGLGPHHAAHRRYRPPALGRKRARRARRARPQRRQERQPVGPFRLLPHASEAEQLLQMEGRHQHAALQRRLAYGASTALLAFARDANTAVRGRLNSTLSTYKQRLSPQRRQDIHFRLDVPCHVASFPADFYCVGCTPWV